MSQAEQTKEQFMEAIFELCDHYYEKMKGILKEDDKGLSSNAKNVLNFLKENPEIAKKLLIKIAQDDIKKHYQMFKKYNKESLEKIGDIKRLIDVTSEKGKELQTILSLLEKRHKDKEKEVNQMVESILDGKDKDKEKVNKQHDKLVLEIE